MEEQRFMGPRHALIRALLASNEKYGITDHGRYYNLLKSELETHRVKPSHQGQILMEYQDRYRVGMPQAPVVPAEPPPAGVCYAPLCTKEYPEPYAPMNGLGAHTRAAGNPSEEDEDFFGAESQSWERPLTRALREQVSTWLASRLTVQEDRRFAFRRWNLRVNGEQYVAIPTWKIMGTVEYETPPSTAGSPSKWAHNPFQWNLTGQIGDTVIHRCGPEVRAFENGIPVCVSRDYRDLHITPPNFEDSGVIQQIKALGPGEDPSKPFTLRVNATVFVWLVRAAPGRTFRYWVSEAYDALRKDVFRRGVRLDGGEASL